MCWNPSSIVASDSTGSSDSTVSSISCGRAFLRFTSRADFEHFLFLFWMQHFVVCVERSDNALWEPIFKNALDLGVRNYAYCTVQFIQTMKVITIKHIVIIYIIFLFVVVVGDCPTDTATYHRSSLYHSRNLWIASSFSSSLWFSLNTISL